MERGLAPFASSATSGMTIAHGLWYVSSTGNEGKRRRKRRCQCRTETATAVRLMFETREDEDVLQLPHSSHRLISPALTLEETKAGKPEQT